MIPKITYKPEIRDLFANFSYNWETLFPAVAVLLGVFFGTFLLGKLKDVYF